MDNLKESVQENVKAFAAEEDGVAVVEIVLILIVLVGLVVIFKTQLTTIVNKILKQVSSKADSL